MQMIDDQIVIIVNEHRAKFLVCLGSQTDSHINSVYMCFTAELPPQYTYKLSRQERKDPFL